MRIGCVLLLLCAIGYFGVARGEECYRYRLEYNDENKRSQSIYPITKFHGKHAAVVNGTCGQQYKAGSPIPGTKNIVNWETTANAPMWNLNPRDENGNLKSRQDCLEEKFLLNCTGAEIDGQEPYHHCKGGGFVNSGVLWYAYNYPNQYSANTGFEAHQATEVYFVADEDGVTSLVFVHDKPENSNHGRILWNVSLQTSGSEKVYLQLRDDPPKKNQAQVCSERKAKDDKQGDCYEWKPVPGKEGHYEGTFWQEWSGRYNDGLVLGPMPSTSFNITIQFQTRIKMNGLQIGNQTGNDVEFVSINEGEMTSGITIRATDCEGYCNSFTSCGKCTDNEHCGWCDEGNGKGKCELAAKGNTCSGTFKAPETCCNSFNECDAHKTCEACANDIDCGWCSTSNTCVPGSQYGPCPYDSKAKCEDLPYHAPWESASAFSHQECPCTVSNEGLAPKGDCKDANTGKCRNNANKPENQKDCLCAFGGGRYDHPGGCIKKLDKPLNGKTVKEACVSNMVEFPDVADAEGCLAACGNKLKCVLWQYDNYMRDCVGCLGEYPSGVDLQRVALDSLPLDETRYFAGNSECKKGCYPGQELKFGQKCFAECAEGFESKVTSQNEHEYQCGNKGELEPAAQCVPKGCETNLDEISQLLDGAEHYTLGTCGSTKSGETCSLTCEDGYESNDVELKCDKGKLTLGNAVSSCVEKSCTIELSTDLDEPKFKGNWRKSIDGCKAKEVLKGGEKCGISCQDGFKNEKVSTKFFYAYYKCEKGKLILEGDSGETLQDNKCVEYKCDTTKLPKAINYKRTDSLGNETLNYLDEITFGCSDGFAIKSTSSSLWWVVKQLQDARQTCNLDWDEGFVPKDQSRDCKEVKCVSSDIPLGPGQGVYHNGTLVDDATIDYSGKVKVGCKTPEFFRSQGKELEVQCEDFSSFENFATSGITCEKAQCDIEQLILKEEQHITSSQKSGIISYGEEVKIGCIEGFYNEENKDFVSVTCEENNFFKSKTIDFSCKPITCNPNQLNLSPGIVPTQSGDVLFGQSVTLRCGKYENDNYFSTVEENKQHRIECKARDSFNVRIDSQLGCDKCSDVAGCAVPETCTTQDNSRCADCSDLKDSDKGAYHDDRGISTICKKCGVDCSSENSVFTAVNSDPDNKECDGTGKINPWMCNDCGLVDNCEEHQKIKCKSCIVCVTGFYLSEDAGACPSCPPIDNCKSVVCSKKDDSKCVECEQNYYIKADGTCARCEKCPLGQKLTNACPGTTKTDDHECADCAIGSYSDNEDAAQCKACPHISTTVAVRSKNGELCICDKGFGISKDKKCIKCNADTYMDQSSTVNEQKVCISCPKNSVTNGATQNEQVAACTCDRGYYASSAEQPHPCKPCAPDTYKSTTDNALNCTNCPAGSVTQTSAPFVSIEQCVCKKGFQAPRPGLKCDECPKDTYKDIIGSKLCTQCPAKSTTGDKKGSTSVSDCVCVDGYIRDNDECKACPAGKFAKQGDDKCTDCPVNSTTLKNVNGNWQKMEAGEAHNISDCICNPGNKIIDQDGERICQLCDTNEHFGGLGENACKLCPANKMTLHPGSLQEADCLCKKGYESVKEKSFCTTNCVEVCKKCAKGSYKDELGPRRCTKCETNMVTTETGSTSINDCVCAEGYRHSSQTCVPCEANYYKDVSGNVNCTVCPPNTGTDGVQNAQKKADCVCDPGFFKDGDACVECPKNTYKEYSSDDRCQSCPLSTSTNGKTGRTSLDDCKCDTGYFLSNKRCERCDEVIADCCAECELGTGVAKGPICTKAKIGCELHPTPHPMICSGEDTYEFGNDIFPDGLDISHCFGEDGIAPATGLICQPKCTGLYENTVPLPAWKVYEKEFCNNERTDESDEEYTNKTTAPACRNMCESRSDCYFFAFHEAKQVCDLSRDDKKCDQLKGIKPGGELNDKLLWHVYQGRSSQSFTFLCTNNGKWGAKHLRNKTAAEAFFKGHCRKRSTTTTTTTTTIELVAQGEGDSATEAPPPETGPDLIIGLVVVVVLILIVAAFVAVVMVHHSKKKREEQERENDREIKKAKSRKDTVISKDDMDKAMQSAMNLSPTGEDDEPMALSNNDDVPT